MIQTIVNVLCINKQQKQLQQDFNESVNRSLDQTKDNINRSIQESKNQILIITIS
jgi:hypothetical protein